METKVCTKCGKELPVDQFNWRSKEKGTRRAECKFCHSNYMKIKYQEKREIVQELKSHCSCAKCGDKRGYLLEYHHSDQTKKESEISRMISNNYQLDRVYDEIEKCVVLCANCHREFHYLNNRDNTLTVEDYLNSPVS